MALVTSSKAASTRWSCSSTLAFALNEASARHLNVAHGLYQRQALSESGLTNLVKWLREGASVHGGRVCAGGLFKFERRKMERILVPPLSLLSSEPKPSAAGSGAKVAVSEKLHCLSSADCGRSTRYKTPRASSAVHWIRLDRLRGTPTATRTAE